MYGLPKTHKKGVATPLKINRPRDDTRRGRSMKLPLRFFLLFTLNGNGNLKCTMVIYSCQTPPVFCFFSKLLIAETRLNVHLEDIIEVFLIKTTSQ